jgi:hypothetical protein
LKVIVLAESGDEFTVGEMIRHVFTFRLKIRR